jgi:twinkle protein
MSNKVIYGNTACPSCRSLGRDKTGDHLVLFKNDEGEQWGKCGRCGHYEVFEKGHVPPVREKKELTDEELASVLHEVSELPQKDLTQRLIPKVVAERYGVRVGLSCEDGATPVSYFFPREKEGEIQGYEVKGLDRKYFYYVGRVKDSDFFGMSQAQRGDVYNKKLFIFEDPLSCMSGFHVLSAYTTATTIKPACVSLPNGAGSIASVMSRNREFLNTFDEIVICMDNDKAGEDALVKGRALFPQAKFARIPKGTFEMNGHEKEIKDANDLLLAGRGQELFNILKFSARRESPAGAVSVFDCLADALKKPEWGVPYPWKALNDMTFGIRWGEMVAIGGGVGSGKTLIAHEIVKSLCLDHGFNGGGFFLEEKVGMTVKNIAGKAASIPFHRPDVEYDEDVLYNEAVKFADKFFLYDNFGQNDWEDIKQCIRFWVIENEVKFIILDNITALVSHLTPSEINTEISKIASELAGMCQELEFTAFVLSHLNAPSSGDPHEEGGQVKEVQFTGSRSLMRWCQCIIGFERDKQAEGEGKNNSVIRLLKERNYGQTGICYTKYIPETGRLVERSEDEVDKSDHFRVVDEMEGVLAKDAEENKSPF